MLKQVVLLIVQFDPSTAVCLDREHCSQNKRWRELLIGR